MKKVVLFMISLMVLASCSQNKNVVPAFNLADMNTEVSPGEDFYQYANGGWMKNNPLRPEYARFGSLDVLREKGQEDLNSLFADMTTMKTTKGSIEQKIADLYKMALDSTKRNADGAEPIKKYLDRIYAISDKAELVDVVAEMHNYGENSFFGTGVDADLKNSQMQILYFGQGGLGIGDRDYYLDESNADLKAGYKAMVEKLFALTGVVESPAKAAENVLKIEEQLAEFSWTKHENRDYNKIYNAMNSAQIVESFKGFDFARYFQKRNIPALDLIVVQQPSFFVSFAEMYQKEDLQVLKDYVAANIILGATSALSDDFYDIAFDFFSRQMSGVEEQQPRWKRAMSAPNSLLSEAVGQIYVKKFFPESSKEKMIEIVDDLKESLGQHISNLDWMGEETKAKALEKLASFRVKIGYPDEWKDYSTLDVDPQKSYYENLRAASVWYMNDNMAKLGKETDKEEWLMSPQTVNAYYNPTTNEICFPAAILQPPFFNPNADDAINYGAIGVVIGHEMTHGFDDQGRLFDKDGNMSGWWTAEDDAAFKAKADILAEQFNQVEILPGLMADGRLSLGENIADQGGISVAYTALQNSFEGKHPEPIDGFTAEQRFFLGYARIWAQNITDEEKERLTKLDVHSLGENRVNVTVRNFQEFFDAFGIKEGDKMFRPEEERVIIW